MYLSMVENPVLSGSIRMEGMQEFSILDGQGALTNITAKWFLVIIIFLPFVCSRQKHLITNHVSPPIYIII